MHSLNLPHTESCFRFYKPYGNQSKIRLSFWMNKKGITKEIYCNNTNELIQQFKKAKKHYEKSIS